MYKQDLWMQRTLEDRQSNLKGKVQMPIFVQMWNPDLKITIGSDMPQETTYAMLDLLGDPLSQEWQQTKKTIVQQNVNNWSKACGLWGRTDLRPTITVKNKASEAQLAPGVKVSSSRTMTPSELQTSTIVDTTAEPLSLSTGRSSAQGEHSPDVAPVSSKPAPPESQEPVLMQTQDVQRTTPERRASMSMFEYEERLAEVERSRRNSASP